MLKHNFHVNKQLQVPHFRPGHHWGKQIPHNVLVIDQWIFYLWGFFLTQQSICGIWVFRRLKLWRKDYRMKKWSHVMFVFIQIFFFFSRYSRVLRGDLATEQGANSCERRQQTGCVGGNFTSPRYLTYVLIFIFCLVSRVLRLTSWLNKKVAWQSVQCVNTCASRSPTGIIHYHESDTQ